MAEILASLDDINSALDSVVGGSGVQVTVVATDENTPLLQISAARIVRGYLARVIDNVTIQSWRTPDETPELVREAAGLLIASQLYFNQSAGQSVEFSNTHYAQILYNRGMGILNSILNGSIVIAEVPVTTEVMSTEDFFPIDATDRAFTLGQQF